MLGMTMTDEEEQWYDELVGRTADENLLDL